MRDTQHYEMYSKSLKPLYRDGCIGQRVHSIHFEITQFSLIVCTFQVSIHWYLWRLASINIIQSHRKTINTSMNLCIYAAVRIAGQTLKAKAHVTHNCRRKIYARRRNSYLLYILFCNYPIIGFTLKNSFTNKL